MKKFFLFCVSFQTIFSAQAPNLSVKRTLSPDTIYHQASSSTPNKTTVNLELTPSGDSILIDRPLDVLLLPDNTGSQGLRSFGDRWPANTNQIQMVYNALVGFLDSSTTSVDRVSIVRWAACLSTVFPFTTLADDPGFVQSKIKVDQLIDGNGVAGCPGNCLRQTALWFSLIEGIKYMQVNKRPGVTPVIVFLTDGTDNASQSCYQLGFSNAMNFIDAIPEADRPIIFTISFQTNDVTAEFQLQTVAARTNGQWFKTQTGNDLTDIFLGITKIVRKSVAFEVHPVNSPMLVDVLGPEIKYAGGFVSSGFPFVPNSAFAVDSSGSFQKIKISVPQVNLGDTIIVSYDLSVELKAPSSSPTVMRTTNLLYHVNGDSSQVSRVFYYKADSTLVWEPLGGSSASPGFVFVLGDPTGIENRSLIGLKMRFEVSPNPFTPATTIQVKGTKGTHAISIYDLNGHLIRNWSGMASVIWNGQDLHGKDVASGTYIVRVNVGERVMSKRIVLMR